MSSKLHRLLIAAAVLAGVSVGRVPVATAAGPCAPYVKQFCPGKVPGTLAAMSCLNDHLAKVSDACKARVQAVTARETAKPDGTRATLETCKPDLDKFCKLVKPGGGRLMRCLQQHRKDLSPPCKAKLPS